MPDDSQFDEAAYRESIKYFLQKTPIYLDSIKRDFLQEQLNNPNFMSIDIDQPYDESPTISLVVRVEQVPWYIDEATERARQQFEKDKIKKAKRAERDKVRANKEAIKREVDERKQYERLRKKFTGQ